MVSMKKIFYNFKRRAIVNIKRKFSKKLYKLGPIIVLLMVWLYHLALAI